MVASVIKKYGVWLLIGLSILSYATYVLAKKSQDTALGINTATSNMAIDVWGLLAKSLVDGETIEEAIARLIAAHEADESAHLGTGESLQSHKASEIIDHLAASIISDKLADDSVVPMAIVPGIKKDYFQYDTQFETIDSWSIDKDALGSSVSLASIGDVYFFIKQLATAYLGFYSFVGESQSHMQTSKPTVDILLKISDRTNNDVEFGLNVWPDGDLVYGQGWFWDQSANKIYAEWYEDSTKYTQELTYTMDGYYHVYRTESDSTSMRWYIDGVLKHTETTHPSTGYADSIISFNVWRMATYSGGWAQCLDIARVVYSHKVPAP